MLQPPFQMWTALPIYRILLHEQLWVWPMCPIQIFIDMLGLLVILRCLLKGTTKMVQIYLMMMKSGLLSVSSLKLGIALITRVRTF